MTDVKEFIGEFEEEAKREDQADVEADWNDEEAVEED